MIVGNSFLTNSRVPINAMSYTNLDLILGCDYYRGLIISDRNKFSWT